MDATPVDVGSRLSSPIPQVGAVLDLDTMLPQTDLTAGNKAWVLRGSCVLVAPDRVLTIRHLLDGFGAAAVFLPYYGIFLLSREVERERQTPGDNLALVQLEEPGTGLTGLRHHKIPSRCKYDGDVEVCGYGQWQNEGFGALDGLQRRINVTLGPPDEYDPDWSGFHNLDISWSSSRNRGVSWGRGNSGGPLLWLHEGRSRIVGISREVRGDQQAASWIGHDRDSWLDNALTPIADRAQVPATKCIVDWIPEQGAEHVLEVPTAATTAHATLSSSSGMRLQMELKSGRHAAGSFSHLPTVDHASGRFLYRSLALDGATAVTVGVAPLTTTRVDVPRVLAQLCVRFE